MIFSHGWLCDPNGDDIAGGNTGLDYRILAGNCVKWWGHLIIEAGHSIAQNEPAGHLNLHAIVL